MTKVSFCDVVEAYEEMTLISEEEIKDRDQIYVEKFIDHPCFECFYHHVDGYCVSSRGCIRE